MAPDIRSIFLKKKKKKTTDKLRVRWTYQNLQFVTSNQNRKIFVPEGRILLNFMQNQESISSSMRKL